MLAAIAYFQYIRLLGFVLKDISNQCTNYVNHTSHFAGIGQVK